MYDKYHQKQTKLGYIDINIGIDWADAGCVEMLNGCKWLEVCSRAVYQWFFGLLGIPTVLKLLGNTWDKQASLPQIWRVGCSSCLKLSASMPPAMTWGGCNFSNCQRCFMFFFLCISRCFFTFPQHFSDFSLAFRRLAEVCSFRRLFPVTASFLGNLSGVLVPCANAWRCWLRNCQNWWGISRKEI